MAVEVWTAGQLAVLTALHAAKEFDTEHAEEGVSWVESVAALLGRAHSRGDGVAVYENSELGHPELGQWQILSYGGEEAQLETREDWGEGDLSASPDHFVHGADTLRRTLPDIGGRINWRYTLKAVVPAETEVLDQFESDVDDDGKTYKIVRFFQGDHPTQTIKTGLTRAEAQDHCHDPETSSSTATSPEAVARTEKYDSWFDGWDED